MTIEEAKKLLPGDLIYPLTDSTFDSILGVTAATVELEEDDYPITVVTLAALIELKERRMEDNVDAKNIQKHE